MAITYFITTTKETEGSMTVTTGRIFLQEKNGRKTRVGTLRLFEESLRIHRKELIFQGNRLFFDEDIVYLNEPECFPAHQCHFKKELTPEASPVAILHKFIFRNYRYLEWGNNRYPVAFSRKEQWGTVYDCRCSLQGEQLAYPALAQARWQESDGQRETTLQLQQEVSQELCMAILMALL